MEPPSLKGRGMRALYLCSGIAREVRFLPPLRLHCLLSDPDRLFLCQAFLARNVYYVTNKKSGTNKEREASAEGIRILVSHLSLTSWLVLSALYLTDPFAIPVQTVCLVPFMKT